MNTTLVSTTTPFIGRSQEIAEISELLSDPSCRLITLVGPGGIGKTRLAMEVAERNRIAFRDGVFFVPLAPLTRSADIIAAIAETMPFYFQQSDRDLRTEFFDFLEDKQSKRILLVLDNFEHLLDGVDIVSEILDATTNLKIIATSREALNLQEEWIRRISGLAYPDTKSDTPLEEYGAVQLFLDRARRIRGDFALSEDISGVIEICRLLEGMPLAIELAVGWLQTLQPSHIAREIESGINILCTRLRNLPERHRSIRSVFDNSWNFLAEDEQLVFQKLSIFRGGFTRDAAAAVAGASLNSLASLVDKSLVRLSQSGRYDIHELLRQYGAERLDAANRSGTVRQAYAFYYLDLLHNLESDIKSRNQIDALNAIAADFENIRNAWKLAIEYGRQTAAFYDAINRAVESISFYGDMRGRYHEAVAMMRSAIDNFPPTEDPARLFILRRIEARLIRLVVLGNMRVDFDALAQIRACLQAAQEQHDQSEIAFCSLIYGIVTIYSGREKHYQNVEAEALFTQSYNIYESLGDRFYMADVLSWGGCPAIYLDDQDKEQKAMRYSLELRKQIGDRNGIAWITLNLTEVALSRMDYVTYERHAREALALMREIGSIKGILHATLKVAQSCILKGDLEEASTLTSSIRDLADESNNLDGKTVAIALRAFLVCVMDEEYEVGLALARESHALSQEHFYDGHNDLTLHWGRAVANCGLGRFSEARAAYKPLFQGSHSDPVLAAPCLALEAAACANENKYTEAAEFLALAFHQPPYTNGWLARWPLISRLRSQLEQTLGEAEFAQAWQRGESADIKTVIDSLAHAYNDLPGLNPAPITSNSIPAHSAVPATSNDSLPEPLSERELEVLALIAGGLSNSDIAEKLSLTIGTVKTHARNIFGKLNVKSRTQAIAQATRYNLL